MPRKSKKKSPKSTSKSSGGGGGIASKRHWIYASSSSGSGGEEDEYSQYLHKRVQRTLVRSVPSTYSYFGNGDDDRKSGEFCCVIFFRERDITCYVLVKRAACGL
jgi:hypothetical protein